MRIFFLMLLILPLAACSSIAKGVTEAILEQEPEDTRECEITGPAFTGVTESVEKQALQGQHHTTKMLMVHGINRHLPGYSEPFRQKISRSLGLTSLDRNYKEIKLQHPAYAKNGEHDELGTLRIYRHFSPGNELELLFYELTWSPITEPRKELIAYDDSIEHTYKRADINKSLKSFMNKTVPDLLIYLGSKKEHINIAVAQSVCWMFSGDWDYLKDGVEAFCNPGVDNMPDVISDDEFFFVTHSLGSRITLDMIHFFSINLTKDGYYPPSVKPINQAIQAKEFNVFMLANQLPLLELAHEPPAITGQVDQYCGPDAPLADKKVMDKMRIVAFSDPNDILSYPVPPRFADEHIDSRLCPEIVNINLNVAQVKDALGLAEFADPLEAHQGYQEDDRVIRIITDGIGHGRMANIVRERCRWTEVTH